MLLNTVTTVFNNIIFILYILYQGSCIAGKLIFTILSYTYDIVFMFAFLIIKSFQIILEEFYNFSQEIYFYSDNIITTINESVNSIIKWANDIKYIITNVKFFIFDIKLEKFEIKNLKDIIKHKITWIIENTSKICLLCGILLLSLIIAYGLLVVRRSIYKFLKQTLINQWKKLIQVKS